MIEKVNEYATQGIPFLLLVDFDLSQSHIFTLNELDEQHIEIQFPLFQHTQKAEQRNDIHLKAFPDSLENYQQKFEIVQSHLKYGNSFLTNLTCETKITSNASLKEIFDHSTAQYKLLFQDKWVCFSPETFVKIKDGSIFSFPMKGTIDASLPNAEQQLMSDAKEIAEHYTIVDLIRNDLSMVASQINVNRFRYIDRIETSGKTLLQASSEISGKLPADFLSHLGDILFTLLPAGSISGAPKKKTLDIIHQAEQYQRGFYTGTAFYFDGSNVDSCVLIRFIEKKSDGSLVYKSGGGITIHSEVEKEYQELIDKIYVPGI